MSSYFQHETAIIDEGAIIGDQSAIWHWVYICKGAKIGNNVSLGQNVFVGNKVEIGKKLDLPVDGYGETICPNTGDLYVLKGGILKNVNKNSNWETWYR